MTEDRVSSTPESREADKRNAATSAAAQATALASNEAKLRSLAAAGNKEPDVPMTPEEKAGGLVGAATYAKRKRKVLEEWRATHQAEALKP